MNQCRVVVALLGAGLTEELKRKALLTRRLLPLRQDTSRLVELCCNPVVLLEPIDVSQVVVDHDQEHQLVRIGPQATCRHQAVP